MESETPITISELRAAIERVRTFGDTGGPEDLLGLFTLELLLRDDCWHVLSYTLRSRFFGHVYLADAAQPGRPVIATQRGEPKTYAALDSAYREFRRLLPANVSIELRPLGAVPNEDLIHGSEH